MHLGEGQANQPASARATWWRQAVERAAVDSPGKPTGSHAQQAMLASKPFARASLLTREVVSGMREHCSCADLKNGQVSGVPQLYAGVNTATEAPWFDAHLRRSGVPVCAAEAPRCRVDVKVAGQDWMSAIAVDVARTKNGASSAAHKSSSPDDTR